MEGTPPSTRFRHTGCPITAAPKSALWAAVSDALGPGADAAAGQLLLMFGGYNTMGEEFGADSTFVSALACTHEVVLSASWLIPALSGFHLSMYSCGHAAFASHDVEDLPDMHALHWPHH